MSQSGPNSGADLFDMANKDTKVPDSAAEPRYIPSKPRPDEVASAPDPNQLGGRTLAEAATNQGDIPKVSTSEFPFKREEVHRSRRPTTPPRTSSSPEQETPCLLKSTRSGFTMFHEGVTQDPFAKGSTRKTDHKKQQSDFVTGASEGPGATKSPGQEELSDERAMDNIERKA